MHVFLVSKLEFEKLQIGRSRSRNFGISRHVISSTSFYFVVDQHLKRRSELI